MRLKSARAVRTDAYIENCFKPSDLEALPAMLTQKVPTTADVDGYWRRVDPTESPGLTAWRSGWTSGITNVNSMRHGVVTVSAGTSMITIYPNVAVLSVAARWRGFLTIAPMRNVYRRMAHQVAAAFDSAYVIWVPDSFEQACNIAATDGLLSDVHASLLADYGPAQETLDAVSPAVAAEADHCPPNVWYIESRPYTTVD